jgi:hypothetical protein
VAESEGVPLNQFVNVAVAEKLSALGNVAIPNALDILKQAGKEKAPMKGDELGWLRFGFRSTSSLFPRRTCPIGKSLDEPSRAQLPPRNRANALEDRQIPTRIGSPVSARHNAPSRRTRRLRLRLSFPNGLSLPLQLQARSISPWRRG